MMCYCGGQYSASATICVGRVPMSHSAALNDHYQSRPRAGCRPSWPLSSLVCKVLSSCTSSTHPSRQGRHSARRPSTCLRQKFVQFTAFGRCSHLVDVDQNDLVRRSKVHLVLGFNQIGDSLDDNVPIESVVVANRSPDCVLETNLSDEYNDVHSCMRFTVAGCVFSSATASLISVLLSPAAAASALAFASFGLSLKWLARACLAASSMLPSAALTMILTGVNLLRYRAFAPP